jgi:hypothetical protein
MCTFVSVCGYVCPFACVCLCASVSVSMRCETYTTPPSLPFYQHITRRAPANQLQ